MKTRIGTSFGLALLLALGVLGTMLALGMFSASKANADVDVTAVAGSPPTPGAAVQVTVNFITNTTLTAGSGQLRVQFDKNWTVPSTIAKERITITSFGTTGGTSNPALDPSVEVDPTTSDITVVLTVGDTNPSLADVQNLISSNPNNHIIVFSPLAGIKNPVVAATAASITNWVQMSSTAETVLETRTAANAFDIVRTITLNSESGANGSTITVTGKAFTSGGTATVFRDSTTAGTVGAFDTNDLILATSSAAIAGGEFTATVLVNTTQFGVGANSINAFDGTGTIATTFRNWSLTGSVTTDKSSVKRGETLVVKLRQFATGAPTVLSIGGAGINVTALAATSATGSADYTVTVPATTALGTQSVIVAVVGEAAARSVTITVAGAPLTLSPSTAVAEQEITVSGSGFNATNTIPAATGVTIQGTAIAAANVNGGAALITDSSGNMVTTVKLPIADAKTYTAGTYELQVVDSLGRTGAATLTIPSRTISLSPTSSRRGTTVTVTGAGFPAKLSVTLAYAGTTVGSVTPDATGNFSAKIEVPTTAGIPSSNTVLATSSGAAGAPTASALHAVASAAITVSVTSAVPGDKVTVSGTGYPAFASATVVNVGGVAAIPTPAPATDKDGSFSALVLVPALSTGTQAVVVTIGGTTGTSSLTITTAPVVPVVTTTATGTVFASVIAQADNLVRVWRYDNATQAWAFYDPRTAFASANTLTTTSTADIVWVNVKVKQTFQGQDLFAGWNLISLK
jgi:hypothetical protein